MNEKGHVLNAILSAVGVGVILEPGLSPRTAEAVAMVTPPIVLGALFPDLDTTFGTHRKTFHNVWVLAIAVAFPHVFGNLRFVWIGIGTHYVLDLLGNRKGMAVFHPLPGFYDLPVGVDVTSRWADVVTLAVTAFELTLLGTLVVLGHEAQLAGPEPPVFVRTVLGLG
jgi:hypothetical protein